MSDIQRMITAKWILRRKYGSRVKRMHRKMDCNSEEVQRITTETSTYKRHCERIL